MKNSLRGKTYHSAEEVNGDLENWFASKSADFYANGKKQFPDAGKSVWTLIVTIFNISDPRTNDVLLTFLNAYVVFIS